MIQLWELPTRLTVNVAPIVTEKISVHVPRLLSRTLLLSLPFAVLLIALLCAGRSAMLRDPGTFWHVSVGDRILQTRALPLHDEFTYTHAGEPWIAQQWLAEIAMSILYAIGKWDSVLLASCILLAATYAAAYHRLRRAQLAAMPAALIVGLVIAGSSYHFLARPHLLTIALSYWLFAAMCDWNAGRASGVRVCLIPLVLAAWANMHGGALGGVATVALCAASMLWRQPPAIAISSATSPAKSAVTPRRAQVLLLVMLCCAAPFVNPYGAQLPMTWFTLMTSGTLPGVIVEHAALSPAGIEFWMLLALTGLYLFALASAPRAKRRLIHLVPLAWAVLAFSRVRHGPIFAVMVPIAIADLYPFSAWRAWLEPPTSSRLSQPATKPHSLMPGILPVVTLTFGLLLQFNHVAAPCLGTGWAKLDPAYWPIACVQALREECEKVGGKRRVFNEMLFGGLIMHEVPQARIFIDDRCELHGDAGLIDYMSLQSHPTPLRSRLAHDGVTLALVRSGSSFDASFAQWAEWRCIRRDGTATLFSVADNPLAKSR